MVSTSRVRHASVLGLCLVSLFSLGAGEMKDMTHHLTEGQMAKHPLHTAFNLTEVFKGNYSAAVPWLAMNEFRMGEHIGTHIDAPYHFDPDGKFLHEIPLARFEGPAVVINIEGKSEGNRNAVVDVFDLESWESEHGRIPDGAWIIMASGWSKKWPDQLDFAGTNDPAVAPLSFPGFSPEAGEWIETNRPGISGIAVDTISCDNGPNSDEDGDMQVHVRLQPLDILCVEMLKDPELIPRAGATFHVWPILIHNGTGAPVRAYATWGDDGGGGGSGGGDAASFVSSRSLTAMGIVVYLMAW